MSIITLPAGIYFGSFAISQKRFDLKEVSDSTGSARDRLISPPRWRLRFAPPGVGIPYPQAALWKTMLLTLRGGVNHLAAYDVAQVAPTGTMRGSPVIGSAGAAKGATIAPITGGTANGTLKAGDWLQIGSGLGSQLVSVTVDVTLNSSGAGDVTFEPPLRAAYTVGTAVTWDKPVAYYKMMSDVPEWAYTPGAFLVSGFNCDFMEQWT
jgi:hypothetical protein